MSFYRNVMIAVAAMSFTAVVIASDEVTTTVTSQEPSLAAQTTDSTTTSSTTTTTTTTEKVNLNTATAKQLSKVKGLSTTKAKSIISWRTKNGSFTSLDQLKEVKGFKGLSEKSLQSIQEQLTTG